MGHGEVPYPVPDDEVDVGRAGFSTDDKQRFWERKILDWEVGRYEPGRVRHGLLEALADRASASLRFRLKSTGELLAPHVSGAKVVDLGCGSGRLGEALLEAGAARYTGYDVAASAVEAGKARAESLGWGDRAAFVCAGVSALPPLEADLVVSLGLMDWLTDEEMAQVFQASGDAHFLHAIAEKRISPTQWIHRAYCWAAYGYRTAGYVPRYHDAGAFASSIRRFRPGPVYVWRHPSLTFGAYMTSLPIGPCIAD